MNTFLTAQKVRKSILSLGAVAAISLPLIVSASVGGSNDVNYSLLNAEKPSTVRNDPETTYVKLQNLSQDVCGSADLHITGSLKQSAQVKSCYTGTLSAAVERLDRPEVTQLHQN